MIRILERYVDRPAIAAVSKLMALLYRRVRLSPLRFFIACMLACAPVQLVIGTLLVLRGNVVDTATGACFTLIGVGLGASATRLLGRTPNRWDAATYKRYLLVAEIMRELSLGTRVAMLLTSLSLGAVWLHLGMGFGFGDALHNLATFVMLAMMTLADYGRAAEPPLPDDGDFQHRAVPSPA